MNRRKSDKGCRRSNDACPCGQADDCPFSSSDTFACATARRSSAPPISCPNTICPRCSGSGSDQSAFFNALIAEQSPFVLSVTSYQSLSAMENRSGQNGRRQRIPKRLRRLQCRHRAQFISAWRTPCFAPSTAIPGIEIPPADAKRAPRIFELRTYESPNAKASKN